MIAEVRRDVWVTGEQVTWSHANPVTGARGRSYADGTYEATAEPDAEGINLGVEDPAGGGTSRAYSPELQMPSVLNTTGSGAPQCTMDGLLLPDCELVRNLLGSGAARQCPDNDCRPRTVWNPETRRRELSPVNWDPKTGQLGYWSWERQQLNTYDDDGNIDQVFPPTWERRYNSSGSQPPTFFGLGFGGVFMLAVSPQYSKTDPDEYYRKRGCITANWLLMHPKVKSTFDYLWGESEKAKQEMGGWIFFEPKTNTVHLQRTPTDGDLMSMPNEGREFEAQIQAYKEQGREMLFIGMFHTHPIGGYNAQWPSSFGGNTDVLKVRSRQSPKGRGLPPVGFIIYGAGKYQPYLGGMDLYEFSPESDRCL